MLIPQEVEMSGRGQRKRIKLAAQVNPGVLLFLFLVLASSGAESLLGSGSREQDES